MPALADRLPAALAQTLAELNWQAVSPADYKALPQDEQLRRIRHSTSHVLAAALQAWDATIQFAAGPATPLGFFYDVVPTAGRALKEEDLATLEATIQTVASRAHPFEFASLPKVTAIALFTALGQSHKVTILQGIAVEEVTLYRCGEFIDLCAGPHVPHTGLCQNVKLLNIAAAHWKGEDTPSLTRVTGTAWASPKDLKRYLEFVEASKARDHRVLGPQLELFSFHPWGAGAFWHPKGVKFRRLLEGYWRDTLETYGYQEICNPILYRKELFETSGHWDHFKQNMFILHNQEGEADFCIKPMNCPDTMLYFKSSLRSYRDLPMRIAEGQLLHRNEATGAMHGLMRTRMFTQDDAHIFVSADQVNAEVSSLFKMLDEVYSLFNLEYTFTLSTRPDNYMGELAVWDAAEVALKQALEATGRPFGIEEGEGAFYGPKIDVQIRDSLGRMWQCGTFQLDFQLPERFELTYIAQDGSQQRPIVIHRAIFGSFERFMGILVEHLGGAFPTWLAPVQAAVLPIGEAHQAYAKQVADTLKQQGFRVEVMDEESINYRIRQAETRKLPYMLVVGDREAENGTVTVRQYKVKAQRVLPLTELQAELAQKVAEKTFDSPLETFNDLFRKPNAQLSTEDAVY
jgi:threonyl-tRNA synthetase